MTILDSIDFELENLYQEWKTCNNENTKHYLELLIKDKQEEYNKIESELIKSLESEETYEDTRL